VAGTVEEFRHRPLGVNAVVLVATGVTGGGHCENLGMRVGTNETGPARNELLADLVARSLADARENILAFTVIPRDVPREWKRFPVRTARARPATCT